MGNYTHYLIYAASSLAEQTYPLALLIDDTDASVSSIHFYGQAGFNLTVCFFFLGGGWREMDMDSGGTRVIAASFCQQK